MGINKSFTLIEMVIVVGVLGFALPVLFAIVFLIIQQQARIYALQEIKKQGDQALISFKNTTKQYAALIIDPSINPLPTLTDICPVYPQPTLTPAPFIYLIDKDNNPFFYSLIDEKIASNSPHNNITNEFLTDNKVRVANLRFTCYRTNQFSPPIVSGSFTVSKSGSDPNPASMNYSTKFQLKSF